MGKTVVLAEIRQVAASQQWIQISETATPGLLERLAIAVQRELERLDTSGSQGRLWSSA
jgi:hypothetical protein